MQALRMPDIELVVARWREDLAWLRNIPDCVRVTVYNKGPESESWWDTRWNVTPLANVGREAHSYLHHLVERYHSPAQCTVFCQGKPFDHFQNFHALLRDLAEENVAVEEFRWIGFFIDADDPRGRRLYVPWSKNHDGRELALDEMHQQLFESPAPEWFYFYGGGQFALDAQCWRRRPVEFYRRARELSAHFPDAAHGFERMWDRVFGLTGVDPALVKEGVPVYFRQQK